MSSLPRGARRPGVHYVGQHPPPSGGTRPALRRCRTASACKHAWPNWASVSSTASTWPRQESLRQILEAADSVYGVSNRRRATLGRGNVRAYERGVLDSFAQRGRRCRPNCRPTRAW